MKQKKKKKKKNIISDLDNFSGDSGGDFGDIRKIVRALCP